MIISASGMCDAGRIKHHLKHNLWRPESTILFVGYQAEGTLGRRLLNGVKNVVIFGEDIAVRARIASIGGFSAHADQGELIKWVSKFKQEPSQIILVHGEEEAQEHLAGLLRERFDLNVYIPSYLEEISLMPLGRELEPSLELSARLKAQQILNTWEEANSLFKLQLSSYLEEENDPTLLLSLEERLGFILRLLEQEAGVMVTPPLYFGPSSTKNGDSDSSGEACAEK